MTRPDDEGGPDDVRADSRTPAAPLRLLNRVREALYEPTRQPTNSTAIATSTSDRERELQTQVEGTLRELIAREIGPALAEFNLQLDAVRDLVPDPTTRLKIALSVLSKKQISGQGIAQDLSHVTSLVGQQLSAFIDKVATRRSEYATEQLHAESACQAARSQSEREIAALEAAIATQRQALESAGTERDQKLARLAASRAELEAKERAFRRAAASLLAEYESLGRDLRALGGEKV